MKLAKEYNGSYIFSEVVSSLNKKDTFNQSYFPSIDLLEKKNSIFNGLNKIDFYCMIDIQNQGEPIFEKNLSLELGLDDHSLINIMGLIPSYFLTLDAEMDKIFSEFHVQNKFEPMDMVLSNRHEMKDAHGKEIILKRNITILSNDENGFPVFGFCGIHQINQPSNSLDEKNFQISFSKDKIKFKEELTARITEGLSKINH